MVMDETQICQSCGMPLQEEQSCGTEADGSASLEYCTYCYQGGEFTSPNLTLDGMIHKIAEVMGKELSAEETERSREFLLNLKRWKP